MSNVSLPTHIVVDRPVTEVFEYMADVTRFGEWVTYAKQAWTVRPADPGEDHINGFGRGTVYDLQTGLGLLAGPVIRTRVVDFSRGRLIAMHSDAWEAGATYQFEPALGGTVIRAQHHTWGYGLGDLIYPVANDIVTRGLLKAKHRIEQTDPRQPRPQIFFSYRRAEMAYAGGRIFSVLEQEFGRGAVFRDIDSIDAGARVRDSIADTLRNCAVVLAVIGAGWLEEIEKRNGQYEKDRSADWVHAELADALRLHPEVRVIGLLVGGTLPSRRQLPDDLKELAERNAYVIRPDPDFSGDVERLVSNLRPYLRGRQSEGAP